MRNSRNQPAFPLAVWLVLLGAAVLRVAYLIIYAGLPDWSMLTVDNYYHLNWARDIAQGNILGDTTYFRAPLYVFVLAIIWAIFDISLWAARILGLLVGVASVAVTYLLGRRVFSYRVGLGAAILYAVWPTALYFEAELLLDAFFLLLLALAVWRLLVWLDRGLPGDAFLVGLLTGLAAVTRPTALLLLAVVAGAMILRRTRPLFAWRHAVLLAAGLVVTVGPVFVRNVLIARDPVLIASQGGINLYIGNNEAADGVSATLPEPLGFNWQIRDIVYIAENDAGRELLPGEVSSYWSERAIAWIGDHPGRFASLYLEKVYRFIANDEISNNRALGPFFDHHPILRYNPLSFGLLFAFAMIGLAAHGRTSRKAVVIALIVLLYIAGAALFFFSSRFRLPLLPYFMLLAAAGAGSIVTAFRTSRRRFIFLAIIGVVAAALPNLPPARVPSKASPQPLLAAANHAFALGDHEAALAYARQAVAVDSTFPEVNLTLGNAFVRLGQPDSARAAFEAEARHHPERVKAYTNIASLALVRDNPGEALQFAQIALEIRPYDYDANLVNVRALFAAPQLPLEALVAGARNAAERTNDDIYLLTDAGIFLSGRGLREDAREMLKRALVAEPPPIEMDDAAFGPNFRHSDTRLKAERARAAYQLGYLAGTDGRFDEAISFSRQAIELDSSLAEAWVNLISGLLSVGRTNEVESLLDEARRRFPSSEPIRRLQSLRQNQP